MKKDPYLQELIQTHPELSVCKDEIMVAFEIIRDSYKNKGKLLVCGNGGSGADGEHIVGELMKEFNMKRPISEEMKRKLKDYGEDGITLGKYLQGALPAITLTSNISLSTAYANDAKSDLVFAQQVLGYGDEKDVLLSISTSGDSRNIIYASKTAKAIGMKTIGLTGELGGGLKALCDICICVPSNITYKIQELHLPVYHTLCLMLEEEFFGAGR